MGNETLRSEINNLERKIKILLSEHAQLKDDVSALKQENNTLKSDLSQKEQSLSGFQNQMKISKIVENMVVEENDTGALKGVIDDYIKEIDKCIAHLGEA